MNEKVEKVPEELVEQRMTEIHLEIRTILGKSGLPDNTLLMIMSSITCEIILANTAGAIVHYDTVDAAYTSKLVTAFTSSLVGSLREGKTNILPELIADVRKRANKGVN